MRASGGEIVENIKKRRNVYMGQEYLDLEAIAVNERKRSGRDIRVSDRGHERGG